MKLLGLLLLMNLCYAGTPVATKLAGLELPPFQIVYLRHTLALLALLPWFLFQPNKKLAWGDFLRVVLASGLAFTLASILQVVGMRRTDAADGTFIMALEPVIVIGLAYFFLKERLDFRTLFGLMLALGGFLAISNPALDGKWIGNFLFLSAMVCEASLPILLKPLLKRYPPMLIAFYCLLVASFYMLPFQTGFFENLTRSGSATWLSVLYLGLGCSFFACILWLYCLSKMTATFVAVSWFLQPIFGCLAAYWLLGEALSLSIAAGGSLIFLALGIIGTKSHPAIIQPRLIQPSHEAQTLVRVLHPLHPAPLPGRADSTMHRLTEVRRSKNKARAGTDRRPLPPQAGVVRGNEIW